MTLTIKLQTAYLSYHFYHQVIVLTPGPHLCLEMQKGPSFLLFISLFPVLHWNCKFSIPQYMQFYLGMCLLCTDHKGDSIKTKQIQRLKQFANGMTASPEGLSILSRLRHIRVFNEVIWTLTIFLYEYAKYHTNKGHPFLNT